MKSSEPRGQEILLRSAEALAKAGDDFNPLWAPLSALVDAHRAVCREADEMALTIGKLEGSLADLGELNGQLAEELESQGQHDALTGLASYSRFIEFLDREWHRARRTESPLSLLLTDIDRFRNYNSQYGHVAGDLCLQRVAALLARRIKRPTDLVARYGSEVFVCVAPDTDLDGARRIASDLVTGVEALDMPHIGSDASAVVTISVGVAATIPVNGVKPFELVETAEAMARQAKQAGHNQAQAAWLAREES